MRNGLSQSAYHQIITYFLGQSSVYIDSMNLSEWHIYGSSRLGIYQTSINMAYRNVRIVNGVTTQETNTTVICQFGYANTEASAVLQTALSYQKHLQCAKTNRFS